MRPILQEPLGRMGISFSVSKSAPLKDIGAFYRQITPEGENRIQALVDEFYASFVSKVATARHMETEQVLVHATGEVFTGRKALNLELVDELRYLDRAIEIAAVLGNILVPRRPTYIRPHHPLKARLLRELGAYLVETMVEETERGLMDRDYYLPQACGP